MAVALEKFVKQLEDSGIIAPGKLENFVPPKAHPKDAEELARQLVKADHLTPFQAQHVLQGKAKALILGNYTVLDKIGAGGMGQVFKAEHRRMHRIVAIKMLPPAMTKDAAALARFEREVTAASKLLHPNIVSAFDADEANGAHFLVMEYVEGKDLSAHVKKNGRFSVDKAVNYTLQAAKGLEFAHAEGVIHRDIKPANLLLDKKGVVKILDMGLARIDAPVGDVAGQPELTGTGAIMGTVDYMAPEQGVSTKDADARADIYSLGCTLHYLLIGKPVYGGDSVGAKFLAHHNQPIPSLSALREDVPEALNTVFKKMVAKKVGDRYQTMTEVVTDLQACGVGNEQLSIMQQSIVATDENSALTFLRSIPAATTHRPKPTKQISSASTGNNKKKLIYGAVGAGLLGVLILAGIIVSLKTKDGTLVVEINQPDAMLQVLDEQGKVEVSQKGGVGKVTISVDPGKHRLKVEKDGFTVFGENFEIGAGGKKAITAKFVPVKVVAGAAQPKQLWNTPAFQAWMKDVQAMPAEKQVETVTKKLVELNPGFDGKVTGIDGKGLPKIDNGVVTELKFVTDNVTDISPVRALAELKMLSCSDSGGYKGKLSDLSPLVGMKLERLICGGTKVSNLSPLQGIPLTELLCNGTNVESLLPLLGMRLTNLNCGTTQVSDLSPLKGMPLTSLSFYSTKVSDLSPLRGMPLKVLSCCGSKVSDLSALQGMNLTEVRFTPENVTKGIDAIRVMKSIQVIGTSYSDKFPPAEFWKKYDAGEFGKPNSDISSPAFQAWVKQTQALPAEQQIAAVARKLVELNPKFDGKVTGPFGKGAPKIENGVVAQFEFVTDDVTDISPVRALAGLKSLSCAGGSSGKGKLADLSPLKGMALTKLYFNGTKVSDLSPLAGMKLTEVGCSFTNASDLAPLRGMPLAYVTCGALKDLSDLSPLSGAPLKKLECYSCNVSDLAPLAGLPLVSLNVGGTKVADLTPLRGLPLSYLVINDTPVSDVSALQGMKLTEIAFTPKNITKGIDVLRANKGLQGIGVRGDRDSFISPAEFWKKYDAGEFGKPAAPSKLAYLDPAFEKWRKDVQALPAEQQVEAVRKKLMELNPEFDGNVTKKIEDGVVTEFGFVNDNVIDISPIRALVRLKTLVCSGSGPGKGRLADISPLKGMNLEGLFCGGTNISDLSPLREMPLSILFCGDTPVADLSPLQGMPITKLSCHHTQATDLSPLESMKLTEIAFTPANITRGLDIIPRMQSLKSIGVSYGQTYSPKEFWKRYDANEFGKH